jgi:hypothetical protein
MFSFISKFVKCEITFVDDLKEVIVHKLHDIFLPNHVVVVIEKSEYYNPYAYMNV